MIFVELVAPVWPSLRPRERQVFSRMLEREGRGRWRPCPHWCSTPGRGGRWGCRVRVPRAAPGGSAHTERCPGPPLRSDPQRRPSWRWRGSTRSPGGGSRGGPANNSLTVCCDKRHSNVDLSNWNYVVRRSLHHRLTIKDLSMSMYFWAVVDIVAELADVGRDLAAEEAGPHGGYLLWRETIPAPAGLLLIFWRHFL